jgi:hypothetical protein
MVRQVWLPLMAVFGTPRTMEQMPQRAVQAVLALRQLIADGGVGNGESPCPEMRMAIHAGHVLVDVHASDPREQLLTIGDTLSRPVRMPASSRSWKGPLGARCASRSNTWPPIPCGARSETRPWHTADGRGRKPWRGRPIARPWDTSNMDSAPSRVCRRGKTRAQVIDLRFALSCPPPSTSTAPWT